MVERLKQFIRSLQLYKLRKPQGMSWQKYITLVLCVAIVVCFSAGLGVFSVVGFQVFFGDDSYLKKSTILAKINEETSIYALDEETRFGSFFDKSHRRYVSIDEVPAHVINAVVASEDKYFYDHVGINPIAIFKAFVEGLKTMHFRGGSTITQQTVKNILDRREYSVRRKFREAIAALQLERLYSKRQILEFYLNQFHVVANGNGIGIAANYYFNKDVRDLNLVEAAFIAGSVKGPSKYNPFIKFTPEERNEAWELANQRKNYVLRRMYEQGWIDEVQFKQAWSEKVPFNRGRFRSHEVALVQTLKAQLNKKEILQALNMDTIEELNNAGLNIYTTIDAKVQEGAQLVMRRNLSRLETILSQGFTLEQPDQYKPLRDIIINQYYFAKVIDVIRGEKPYIKVDLGLPKGIIPYESLVRFSKLLDMPNPRSKGWQSHLDELLLKINSQDILFVEAREYDNKTHQGVFELQLQPSVSGGFIVLDKGEVRALISGFDTKGYNRALFATRQPGSVFKAVVYYAALQLGWSMLDRLDNERRVFPYQGQFYYPRPDHESPYRDVSMIWAGTMSENLASIYLTSRLVEKLSLDQFKALLGTMDLLPQEGEAVRDYHYRVARQQGVQLDNHGVREFQLQRAISAMEPDLVFSGQLQLLRKLQKMWMGKGYVAEIQNIYVQDEEEVNVKEKQSRLEMIKNNFDRFTLVNNSVTQDWTKIQEAVQAQGAEALLQNSELMTIVARFRVLASRDDRPQLGYFKSFDGEEPSADIKGKIELEPLPGRPLNALDIQAIWSQGGGLFGRSAEISLTDVNMEGYLPVGVFVKLEQKLEELTKEVMAVEDPYNLFRYYHHHDFRIAVGLNYLVNLCNAMGVYSKIEPVLSFPLGTNDVSVAEVAKIYQTFIDGKIYQFYEDGPPNQLNFIRRIEDRYGNILYESKRKEFQIAKSEFAMQMRQILYKVITHGTGRRARGELYVELSQDAHNPNDGKKTRIRVPAFGKTGTTNDYRTASFAGFVPYPVQKAAALDPSNSYVLTSYVGYDFNKIMTNGILKITGAAGALPGWTDLAKLVIEQAKYADYLDALDLNLMKRGEWPLTNMQNSIAVKVDLPRGVVIRAADQADNELFDTTDLGVTGESYFNEFSLTTSVKSVVTLPQTQGSEVFTPLRIFSPFLLPDQDKQKNIISNISQTINPPPALANSQEGQQKKDVAQPGSLVYDSQGNSLQNRHQVPVEQAPTPGWINSPENNNDPNAPSNNQGNSFYDPAKKEDQSGNSGLPKDGGNDDPGYVEDELW